MPPPIQIRMHESAVASGCLTAWSVADNERGSPANRDAAPAAASCFTKSRRTMCSGVVGSCSKFMVCSQRFRLSNQEKSYLFLRSAWAHSVGRSASRCFSLDGQREDAERRRFSFPRRALERGKIVGWNKQRAVPADSGCWSFVLPEQRCDRSSLQKNSLSDQQKLGRHAQSPQQVFNLLGRWMVAEYLPYGRLF